MAEMLNKRYEMSVQKWDATDRVMLSLVCIQSACYYESEVHSSGLLVVTFFNNIGQRIATYTNVCYVKEL